MLPFNYHLPFEQWTVQRRNRTSCSVILRFPALPCPPAQDHFTTHQRNNRSRAPPPRRYSCYYLTRNSLTYTAPVMVADPKLGMDITQIGAMTSIFPIAYGMSKFVSGVLGARCGGRCSCFLTWRSCITTT